MRKSFRAFPFILKQSSPQYFHLDTTKSFCFSRLRSKNHDFSRKSSHFQDIIGNRCYSSERFQATRGISEAQAALMDYLHYTRSLHFTDAEHISMNSPNFVSNLLKKVKNRDDVKQSITRFLNFHPINEFEPFFESLGLIPSEIKQWLPKGLMFLSDDSSLLCNYHALVNYGIPHYKIGKIFKEAAEITWNEDRNLTSKLCAYEELGLSRTSVIKIVSCVPSLLIDGVDREFVKVLEELNSMGLDHEWIGRNISEESTCIWGRMLILLQFFAKLGFSKLQTGTLIDRNPGFLLDHSGDAVFSLVGILTKMGSKRDELSSLLFQFPAMKVETFANNLRFSLKFLIAIEMDPDEIKEVIRSHHCVLGTCFLKTPCSVLTSLSIGRKRLCEMIKEDPHQFKNFVHGSKLDRLPRPEQDHDPVDQKEKFLLSIGFVKDSKEMKNVVAKFRSKGDKLQERFDCFVKAGLAPEDVTKMIKLAPHILNLSRDVLEVKMDFLVNGLGYKLESLVVFPAFLSFTLERIKRRFFMYDWLKKEGKVKPNLAMSTVLAAAEKVFLKRFVHRHPKGAEVWEKLKKSFDHSSK